MDKQSILIPFIICCAFCSLSLFGDIHSSSKERDNFDLSNIMFLYSQPKDTIHLLSDVYVLLSLKKQTATVVQRGDSPKKTSFPISSGHAGIEKGMATPPGLYTVQSKLSKAISKQFNNAELINWVGFNGNIGFHGLSTSGYYAHLGVRPSSHGCVRISREDGKKLSDLVQIGTPVLVYSEEPAVSFSFSNIKNFNFGNDILLEKKTNSTDLLVKSRLDALYSGEYYKISNSKLFVNGKSIIRNRGFAVGLASKISKVQRNFNTTIKSDFIKKDITNYLINDFQKIEKDNKNFDKDVDSALVTKSIKKKS